MDNESYEGGLVELLKSMPNQPIQPKSPAEILREGKSIHTAIIDGGMYYEGEVDDWLRESMASLLAWTANQCVEDFSFLDAVYDKILNLANDIQKKK